MICSSLPVGRRDFCHSVAAVAAGTLVGRTGSRGWAATPSAKTAADRDRQAREFLRDNLYTREELHSLIHSTSPRGETYDPAMGWVHHNRRSRHGVDNSVVTYRYDTTGARRMMHYGDRPCRINTYGNSFTHCDQVSDGETWQEVLAAHLIEPVRNYGVGGYSVYQAYLRMIQEEAQTPGDYIIFNIYYDDHYRNLHSWRFLRAVSSAAERDGAWGPPLPFLKVNPSTGEFREYPNPCPTAASFASDMLDLDWVYKVFKDDFVLRLSLARRNIKAGIPQHSYEDIECLAQEQGVDVQIDDADSLASVIHRIYTRAGLWASMRVIEKVEKFAHDQGKKVLYVLSYGGAPWLYTELAEGRRFDQPLVDFLQQQQLDYVDLLLAHRDELARFNEGTAEYLSRYYVGHYNPRGNFFCAYAIKDTLVSLLEPKPVPYVP